MTVSFTGLPLPSVTLRTSPRPAESRMGGVTLTPVRVPVLRLGIVLGFAVAGPGPVVAQAPADASMQVDEIFAPWTGNRSPGCAVGVVQNGITVLERAYGMADLEHDVPNTPETIFEGGSLSKQFTAAAVVLLALEGKLSLTDDIRTYLPEIPDYGHTITLRHLMTHTSGLRDWGSVAGISGWGREQRSHDHADVLDILSRQSALNFIPGHEYSYSNSGFNLLAIIVGRVSGMPFAEFSRQRIFEPLGLRNTQWRDDYRRLVPGRSTAYSTTVDGWEINRPIEYVHGNGGILTTVGDLGIWNQALTDGRLGGPEFVRMMHETGELNDGSRIVYAGGLRVEPFRGVPSVNHTGSTAGYRAFLGRYPDQSLSVAMLCNASNVSTGGTGGDIASVYLGDLVADRPQPDFEGASADVDLTRWVGLYRDPVTGNTTEISMREGLLVRGSTPLLPLTGGEADAEFRVGRGETRLVFQERDDGGVAFQEDAWQYSEQLYERVEPWAPTEADLAALAGIYHSDDAETRYAVSVADGELTIRQRPDVTRTLQPIYRDAFRMGGSIVRFQRDGSGAVDGLSLSLGRVYDMRFERITS